jgi:hypothetical protein
MAGTDIAKRLGATQAAVSQAVTRGRRVIEEKSIFLKGEE